MPRRSISSPQKADLRSAYGESLVRAAGGTVTDQARSAFQEALRLDGKDARARFFIAMRKAQDGDKRSALDDWVAILNEADSKEPWFADLTQRVTELSRELDVDVSAASAAPQCRGGRRRAGAARSAAARRRRGSGQRGIDRRRHAERRGASADRSQPR